MWYTENEDEIREEREEDDDEDDDDEGDDEEEEDVPLLESGVTETEADRPTVLETFIMAVDESLSLLLHWSAKNWKLDGDIVESDKEEDEDEDNAAEIALESHVPSHALPLLKVVRKYLKKVERTLKGSSPSPPRGGSSYASTILFSLALPDVLCMLFLSVIHSRYTERGAGNE